MALPKSDKPSVALPIMRLMELRKGGGPFLEHEGKALLGDIGLPVPRGLFVRKGEQVPCSLDLSYPLVAKVSSSAISSKSDVGGVKKGLSTPEQVNDAVSQLLQISLAEGVLIEEEAPSGVEVIIGGVIDEQFGPVVMFGLGGVFVELFEDVAFALAPLGPEHAQWLIDQPKGSRILKGYRTYPSADMIMLVEILSAVSELMATGLVKEINLNPVTVYRKGAMILDVKLVPLL